MKFQIRSARPDDSPALVRVCHAAIDHTGPDFYTQDQITAWRGSSDPQKFADKMKKTNGQFFVAENREGEIVGMIGYHVDDQGRHRGGPYVDPDAHGHGIGRQLLKMVMDLAKRNGAKKLFVSSTRPAEMFYKKMGFRVMEPTEFQLENVQLPVIDMEIDL